MHVLFWLRGANASAGCDTVRGPRHRKKQTPVYGFNVMQINYKYKGSFGLWRLVVKFDTDFPRLNSLIVWKGRRYEKPESFYGLSGF